MMLLTAVVVLIGIFEIKAMMKDKLKKEVAVFIAMGIITLAFGYISISNIYTLSLINDIFNLLGIKY